MTCTSSFCYDTARANGTAKTASPAGRTWTFLRPVVVRGSTFSGNTASDSGGAIYNAGTATFQESTLSGNSAGSDGGGIFSAVSGKLAVKDSVVFGNVALLGGDLYNAGFVFVGDSIIGDWYDV